LPLGLLLSAVRWTLSRSAARALRVKLPTVDYGRLADQGTYAAFNGVVENHYRYYQYYANSLVALVVVVVVDRFTVHPNRPLWIHALCLAAAAVLFCGSRDALKKYCERMDSLLSPGSQLAKEVRNDQRVGTQEDSREAGSKEESSR